MARSMSSAASSFTRSMCGYRDAFARSNLSARNTALAMGPIVASPVVCQYTASMTASSATESCERSRLAPTGPCSNNGLKWSASVMRTPCSSASAISTSSESARAMSCAAAARSTRS